jgi:predicted nucleotidyltransferase
MIPGVEALLARARREQAEWESLRSKVREALPGLVAVLVREYGVRRVTLFGSLLHRTPSERPDIDLLVEGLDSSRRAEALGRLFLLAPLPVDLVPREIGRQEIVQRALDEGEILYAA